MTHPSYPTRPIPAEADKPRVVIDYGGMQIVDCRERVQVLLGEDPPRGIRGSLRIEGFKENRPGVWEAPANPKNIMSAQVIGSTYFADKS